MRETSKAPSTSGSKRLVFFGNERIATGVDTDAPHLRMLIEEGYQITAVVAKHEPARSRKARMLEVQAVADMHHIPVLTPNKLADIKSELLGMDAEAGILIAYGKIIPESIIGLFPKGIINIHPSLLPLHRGPTPVESVILHNDVKTGVSIMALAKEMDAGPIYAQSELELMGNETKQELADILSDIGVSMLREVLPGILDGSVVALPQDHSCATYGRLVTKEDGRLDWDKSAAELEREIRAYAGWPGSTTELAGKHVVITDSVVSNIEGEAGCVVANNKELHICCNRGSLQILRLKPAGKQEMTAQAFLAGHPELYK